MEKLKGLYVSHRVENRKCLVFLREDSQITKYDLGTLLDKQTEEAMKWLKVAEAGGNLKAVLRATDIYNAMAERANLYGQIITEAEAGLPIGKYWKGEYAGPRSPKAEKSSLSKKRTLSESEKVKRCVSNLEKKYPQKTKDELFHKAAEKLNKTYEATKRNYYYPSKKVTKKVT